MPFTKGQPGGPGRKPKHERFARPIAKAEKQIIDKLPWLIEKELQLADGVWREQILPDGETRIIYQEKPNHRAITYLIDRVMGRPVERAEVTGADGGPIQLAPVDYRAGLDALKPDDADA